MDGSDADDGWAGHGHRSAGRCLRQPWPQDLWVRAGGVFGVGVACSVYADAKVFVEEGAVSGLPTSYYFAPF